MGTINKLLVVASFLLLFFPLISSIDYFGTFEYNTTIELLQICSNDTSICDYCNISSIKYPNSTIIISDINMEKRAADFNYSLSNNYVNTNGEYLVSGYCGAGGELGIFTYVFVVTPNGNQRPGESVVVLFTILFLIVVGSLLSLILYNIFRMAKWDFDAKDLIYNISGYFILFSIYILSKEYLGNLFIDSFLEWMIYITALTNVVLPVVAFIMSYIKGGIYGGKNE